jgi:hypothetical protein
MKNIGMLVGTLLIGLEPLAAGAVTLEPYIATTAVKLGGVGPDSVAEHNLSAVSRIDPITGGRGESGSAIAVARGSGLAVAAVGDMMGGDGSGPARTYGVAAEVRVRAFDLVLSDETGSAATTTDISMSFMLDGFLAIAGANNDGRSSVSSTLTIDYGLGQAGPGGTAVPEEIGKLRLDTFPFGFDDAVRPATGIFERSPDTPDTGESPVGSCLPGSGSRRMCTSSIRRFGASRTETFNPSMINVSPLAGITLACLRIHRLTVSVGLPSIWTSKYFDTPRGSVLPPTTISSSKA